MFEDNLYLKYFYILNVESYTHENLNPWFRFNSSAKLQSL